MIKTPYWDMHTHNIYLDYVKFEAEFEIVLKSILLEKNFIVHEIQSSEPYTNLSKNQRKTPIKKQDLFAISQYKFDGISNYLPGLTKKSLDFRIIVQKPNYIAQLGIDPHIIILIDEIRSLRNQIHLAGDPIDTPILKSLKRSTIDIILEFVNHNIIEKSNFLMKKHGRDGPFLQHLT